MRFDAVSFAVRETVYSNNNTLHAVCSAKLIHEVRPHEGGGIDADFICACGEARACGLDGFNPARHTEGDVERAANFAHPIRADRAVIHACCDVIKHKLICAFIAVAKGKVDDVADIFVIAKLHAFDNASISHIKARYDAAC